MSCSQFDIKGFILGGLDDSERNRTQQHVKTCSGCGEELDRLRLTEASLRSLADEEVPRRIAFVSDKVFAPRWWHALWNSATRLGFASAAMLAAAIFAHGLLRPAPDTHPSASIDPAAIERRISEEVLRRLGPAIEHAVATSEARQTREFEQLVAATKKNLELRQAADRVAIEQAFVILNRKVSAGKNYAANFGGSQ